MTIFESLTKAGENIKDTFLNWGEQGVNMLPNFLVALLVVFGFVFLAKIIAKILNNKLLDLIKNEAITGLIVSVTKISVIVFGILTALGILHLDKTVTSILAGVGIVGIAFSFAFQHTADNLLSGIIIASKTSIKIGHLIEVNGIFGEVKRVGLRATYIDNAEGQIVSIPNRLITDDEFKDYTISGERRIDVHGHVCYSSDLNKVVEVLKNAVSEERIPLRNNSKEPEIFFNKFDDYGIAFELRFFMKFDNNNGEYLDAKHYAIKNVAEDFRNNNIIIPYPVRTLEISQNSRDLFKA